MNWSLFQYKSSEIDENEKDFVKNHSLKLEKPLIFFCMVWGSNFEKKLGLFCVQNEMEKSSLLCIDDFCGFWLIIKQIKRNKISNRDLLLLIGRFV